MYLKLCVLICAFYYVYRSVTVELVRWTLFHLRFAPNYTTFSERTIKIIRRDYSILAIAFVISRMVYMLCIICGWCGKRRLSKLCCEYFSKITQ